MKQIALILAAVVLLGGCAITRRVSYDALGKKTTLSHYQFVMKEDIDLDVKAKDNWHLKAQSQPDPASMAMIERLIELAKQVGKAEAMTP